MKQERFTLIIPTEIMDQLRARAEAEFETVTGYVRRLLRDHTRGAPITALPSAQSEPEPEPKAASKPKTPKPLAVYARKAVIKNICKAREPMEEWLREQLWKLDVPDPDNKMQVHNDFWDHRNNIPRRSAHHLKSLQAFWTEWERFEAMIQNVREHGQSVAVEDLEIDFDLEHDCAFDESEFEAAIAAGKRDVDDLMRKQGHQVVKTLPPATPKGST